jgi:DNA-binding NarL/FixJ family response regulator
MTIKTLIADDHAIVREGLKAILQGSDVQVVAEASSGNEAFKLAKKHHPDVAILDVRMPEGDGLSCLARIKLDLHNVSVVMLSSQDNASYKARALALGAAGYLLKSAPAEVILHGIRAAASGESIWTKEDLRGVTGGLMVGNVSDVPLTNRESQVLKQVASGLTNKEIGQTLGISYETVKEHVQHILRKLNVSDRTQAAVWAVRNDLA